MSREPRFVSAFPYQDDVLALPVKDLDSASQWYCQHFAMTEVDRQDQPQPTVILERDGTRMGFALTGADASQDGAAILVTAIHKMKSELESYGVSIGDLRIDERDGQQYEVFFVVAPDGLCYYFHEPLNVE